MGRKPFAVYQQAILGGSKWGVAIHRVLLIELHRTVSLTAIFLSPALRSNACQPQLKVVVPLAQVVEEVA